VWYGGLTITCLTSLILFCFPNGIHLLSIPVFFIGFVASLAISNNIGFWADLVQWRINTEKNLNEIKNRNAMPEKISPPIVYIFFDKI
jgi:hypothetical protein